MPFRVRPTARGGFSVSAAHLAERFAADPRIASHYAEQLRVNYKRHADNALVQIGKNLRQGFPGQDVGGVKQAKFVDADGVTGHIRTGHWAPLSPKYLRSRLKRHQPYWRQEGIVSQQYDAATSQGVNVLVTQDPVTMSHHKGKIRLGYQLSIASDLGYELEKLVLEPFITGYYLMTGAGYSPLFGSVDRQSIGRIVFPETGPYRRPFVAQLSAALGRRALTALRRL